MVKPVQLGHGVHGCSSSWLIGHARAGGRSRRRQAKRLLRARAGARKSQIRFGGKWRGWLEMSYGWRTHSPISEAMRQRLRDHIARRPNRLLRTHSVETGRHHMAGSTPKRRNPRGMFHPRSVRPRPSNQDAAGWLLRESHSHQASNLVSKPTTTFMESPLAHLGFTAPANGATGCSLGERQNPSWIPSLTGVPTGHQACDSFKSIARSGCVFVPDRRPERTTTAG